MVDPIAQLAAAASADTEGVHDFRELSSACKKFNDRNQLQIQAVIRFAASTDSFSPAAATGAEVIKSCSDFADGSDANARPSPR